MTETLHQIASYLPTGLVALIVGYWGYKNTRAGQRDTTMMQEKANSVSETQLALQAYKDLYEKADARANRAEAELTECRRLVREDFEKAMRSVGVTSSSSDTHKTKNHQRKEHS